ncbi:MAG TPA: Wzz/FepE/Etk N-terminal domain-containing protein [Chitinophagaceae bacterium]|nr:Wzz/FepE/Etk N-terminal domain-containing protein [Chitinophagaceae bacterium]
MEFLYLFKALNRRKWLIIGCVMAALVVAYLLTSNQKPEYKSVTQIATGFTTTDEVRLSDERYNGPQAEIKFNNVIENFNSTKVLSLLSYDLLLHDLIEKTPFKVLTPDEKQHEVFKKLSPQAAQQLLMVKLDQSQPLRKDVPEEKQLMEIIRLYDYDVETISKKLLVSRVPRTDYINLTFTSGNPELSAYALNTLVRKFENYYYQNKQQRSDTSIANLDSLVQQKKIDLDRRMAAKTAFMAERGIVDVTLEGSNALQQKGNIQNQLTQARGDREELTFKIQQLDQLIRSAKSANSTTANTSGSGDNLTYVSLKNQYNKLYREYVQKGSNDPDMYKQLTDLNNHMRQLEPSTSQAGTNTTGTTYLDDLVRQKINAEGQLRAANSKIATLQSMLNQNAGGLNSIASKSAGIEQFDREIQLATADYNKAKERLNMVQNVRNMGINSFTQTLVAQPALQPEPSHRALILALAGISAFILSALVVMLLAFLDSSIRTPSQFQQRTNLKLLGVVNNVKLNAGILEGVGTYGGDHKLRNDTFRELLRKVRYEIENSGKKIFLFTSTEPRQGKTTLIQALSYSLSLVKKKVLIIDTNFCNNDLTAAISAKPVLEKFHVNGRGFMLEDIKPLITKTSVEGVDMIGCEGGNYTPREILPQNHLLNYLPELTSLYDFIFLEGAPLNDYTDTKELIHFSDGIVAVFSSEASLSAIDKESIRFFKQNEKKFLGAILNKVQVDDLNM